MSLRAPLRPLRGAVALASTIAAALPVLSSSGCGDVVTRPILGLQAGTSDASSFIEASAFCQGHGPIPLPGRMQCTGDLTRIFRFAACACTTIGVSGRMQTDSFDSRSEGGTSIGDSASIAANQAVATNSHTSVGGSIWSAGTGLAAGTAAITLRGDGTVAHDIRAGGDVDVAGIYQVGGDVWSSGNVTVRSGSLAVVGSVHVPSGSSASGVTTGGGVVSGPVNVSPPCDCASPIDVVSIVRAHQADNDDATIGLGVGVFDHPTSAVQLPCGRYYVDGIFGGEVRLVIAGRVALFVAGDLSVDRGLEVDLAPDAELDLFVAGSVAVQGSTVFGAMNAPARVRLYVGGVGVELSAAASIGANIYAPNANVALSSAFQLWGALFANRLELSGDFAIHYDASVLQTSGCAPTGGGCATCNDCGGPTPACRGGTCGPCATDDECCAPLACRGGACVLPPR